jgi:hypothetical protein
MKRALAVSLAAVAVTIALAGCGGKASERSLTSDDVISIVGPVPDTPAGSSYLASGGTTQLGLADLRARAKTASDRATVATLENAGLVRIYQRSFNGGLDVADATAYLFRSAAGAGAAFAGLRASLAHQAQPDRKLTEVSADGLGDERWGAHLSGGSEAALFLFRTSNLVVVTDMSCDADCGTDIAVAARAYAEAIATRASQVAG